MAFKDCVDNAVAGKEINREQGDWLVRSFDRLRARQEGADDVTAAAAKDALAELLDAQTVHERVKAKLTLQGIKRIKTDLDSYTNGRGEKDVAAAALYLLEHNGEAPFSSVAGRQKSIIGSAHAKMEDALNHFRRGALLGDKGRHNAAQLDNVARELFGENTGDARARELAGVWSETAEWLRRRFNNAGGAIGKLENWGLPQHHSALALRRANRAPGFEQVSAKEAWKQQIMPRLDPAKMRHPLSGVPVEADELEDLLDEVFDTIVTEGRIDMQAKRRPAGLGALANQRSEHRFLIFKSADDWLAYQRDFGEGDVFAAMMGHVNMMARDISALEILTPNPQATVEWLKQIVDIEGRNAAGGKPGRVPGKDPTARAGRYIKRIDEVWGSIRGALQTPVSTRIASTAAGTRNFITASVLGGASLSAISDVGTSAIARKFAGLPAGNAVFDIVDAMRPTTRRYAVAAGLIFDNAQHVFQAQARYIGTLNGPAWTSYVADRVLTWSGLTPWTQAARHAFGLAFMREAADMSITDFADLNPLFRGKFEQYGIGPGEWAKIRNAQKHDMGDGAKILRAQEIAAIDEQLADRFLEMIMAETEFAVPSGNHRSRTALIGQNQPGTLMGEMLRSFSQFKSFGAVFAMLYGGKIHRMITAGQTGNAAVFASSLLFSSMVFGAIATQLKQVAAGRDPRDMTTPAFWGAAMLQGGGLGLYGDFFFSDVNRYGGGLTGAFAGPMVERVNSFRNLTLGNAIELANGDITNAGRELVQFLRGNVPVGNIFYLRLAWERLALDNLQRALDPHADASFRAKAQFWEREYGQEFYWAPGQGAPSRPPDPTAVFGP